ncbi:2-dehydro-3-deoxyphosphogluconate aldolase, partial [Lachnotalea glycerini]
MVSDALVKAGKFDEITRLTKEAVTSMLGFELKHVGINASNETEADSTANSFEKMFGFEKKAGSSSIFAGSGIEVMKTPYLGAHGHIAIATNYIERAKFHMEMQGFKFDESTAKTDDKGNLKAIYFVGELSGFAVHLVQK